MASSMAEPLPKLSKELLIPNDLRYLQLETNVLAELNNLKNSWFTNPDQRTSIEANINAIWEQIRVKYGKSPRQARLTSDQIKDIVTLIENAGSIVNTHASAPPPGASKSNEAIPATYDSIPLPAWLVKLQTSDATKYRKILNLLDEINKYKKLSRPELIQLLELGHRLGNTYEVLDTTLRICKLEGKYTNYAALLSKLKSDTNVALEHLHSIIRNVVTECEKYPRDPVAGKPLTILGLIFIESRFNQGARSPADCYGLMQLKQDGGYGQFAQQSEKYSWDQAIGRSRASEKINVEIGIWYLNYLYGYSAYGIQLKGWKQIGAYNGGPGNPQRDYYDDVIGYATELRNAAQK